MIIKTEHLIIRDFQKKDATGLLGKQKTDDE